MEIKCRDVKRKCTPPCSVSDLNPRIRVTNFRIQPTCTTFPSTSRPFQQVSYNTSDACWTSAISNFDLPNVENRNVQGSFSNQFIVPFNLMYQIVFPPTPLLLRYTISRLALSHNMSKSCGFLRSKNVTFRRNERKIFILLVCGTTRLFVLQTRGSMAT